MFKLIKKPERGIFFRFAISYIILLFVLVFFFMYSYRYSYSLIKNYIQLSNLESLNHTIDIMDQQFEQINKLVSSLSNDRVINEALEITNPVKDPQYGEYKISVDNFNNYLFNQSFVDSSKIFIYMKNSDRILLPHTLYSSELYFGQVLHYPFSFYDKWKEIISGIYYEGIVLPEDMSPIYNYNREDLIFLHSIPYSYFKSCLGTVVIPISKTKISKLFERLNVQNKAIVYILDKDNNKIIDVFGNSESLDELPEIDFGVSGGIADSKLKGNTFFISYAQSKKNEWKYISIVPESVIYESLYKYQSFTYFFLAVIVLIGIVISIFSAYSNSKPIVVITRQLADFLSPGSSWKNSFSEISGGIAKLIENNHQLNIGIQNSIPIIKNNFLSNLFNGQLHNREEFDAISRYIGINLDFEQFGVIFVGIYDALENRNLNNSEYNITEINAWKTVVKDSIARFFEESSIIYDLDYKTIGILVNYKGLDFEAFAKEQIECVNNDLFKLYNMKVYAGASKTCTDPLEIWHVVGQAEKALSFATISVPCVWHDDIFIDGESYYFPLDLEQRLINFTKSCDKEQLEKLLELIYKENFIIRKLSPQMSRELILELKSSVNKIFYGNQGAYPKQLQNSAEDDFYELREYYLRICESFIMENEVTGQNLINEVKKYIDDNYTNPDLGLYKLSSTFNLSEGYFSYVFKEQTGVNFTDYVESIRLSKACELIKNSKESIDIIAQSVGYNNSQTFRRAFKKVYGVIPTSLRKGDSQ